MQDFIHRTSLKHYRKLLADPLLDEAAHKYVSKLLADEETKDWPPLQARGRD